jgi:uncharacterized protein YukE
MNDLAHPRTARHGLLAVILTLVAALAALGAPAPAQAGIAVNPGVWDSQAANLRGYAATIQAGGADADTKRGVISELQYVRSTLSGSAAQAVATEEQEIQSLFANSMSVFAVPRLQRIAGALESIAQAYRDGDARAGAIWPA